MLMLELSATYKNWVITYNPKPIPDRSHDYDFTHKDYDGPGDNRASTARSMEEAKFEIDNWKENYG